MDTLTMLPKKVTPGPWRYFPHAGSAFYIHSESKPIAARVASVLYTDGAHSFHEANAKLIAAAPDLLEQLCRVEHTLSVHGKVDANTDLHETVRAAIAKATGEA